jgi:hypothetical protein
VAAARQQAEAEVAKQQREAAAYYEHLQSLRADDKAEVESSLHGRLEALWQAERTELEAGAGKALDEVCSWAALTRAPCC